MSGAGGVGGDARAGWKGWSAVGMIALAGLVVLLVLGFPASGSRPLAPALVPYVGWPFALAFLAAQIAFFLHFGERRDLVLVFAVWLVIVPLIYLGTPLRWSPLASAGVDRAVVGAACGSALALGLAALRRRRT
jgi:hypothetical protein